MNPTKSKFTVLKQVCEIIPRNLVSKLSEKHGVDKKSRTFSPWSHVISMMFTQISHSLSLNDTCDTLRHHKGVLTTIRKASPPSRNGLSHANKVRNADMAEELFWEVLAHLHNLDSTFGGKQSYSGMPRRFKRTINVIDSSTIQLISSCLDWAKHRRRKAAAKCHMRLDLESFLPLFAIIKEASTHDASEARRLCSGIQPGEISIFDKAYVDFSHLYELDQRGIFWVTRAKDNMAYSVVRSRPVKGTILSDEDIELTTSSSNEDFPDTIRLVTAVVQVNGKATIMRFITNNKKWAASSICDLYKARWAIEVFFKQLKQTLQLADFLGQSKNAVRWQIWTALLTYIILRFISHLSKWKGSFSRLFTALRGVLWETFSMVSVLDCCGTARGPCRISATPFQAYQVCLPGIETM